MQTLILWLFVFFFTATVPAFAHTPVLMIVDNEDGTLTAEGGFSTGASAEGIDLYVKTKKDGKILLQRKFPESSTIEIDIPNEPYYVIFDGGPGHKIVKDGVPPPGGFTVNATTKQIKLEKSDASGIPLPLPAILLIVGLAVVSVFLVPKLSKKDKATKT